MEKARELFEVVIDRQDSDGEWACNWDKLNLIARSPWEAVREAVDWYYETGQLSKRARFRFAAFTEDAALGWITVEVIRSPEMEDLK